MRTHVGTVILCGAIFRGYAEKIILWTNTLLYSEAFKSKIIWCISKVWNLVYFIVHFCRNSKSVFVNPPGWVAMQIFSSFRWIIFDWFDHKLFILQWKTPTWDFAAIDLKFVRHPIGSLHDDWSDVWEIWKCEIHIVNDKIATRNCVPRITKDLFSFWGIHGILGEIKKFWTTRDLSSAMTMVKSISIQQSENTSTWKYTTWKYKS